MVEALKVEVEELEKRKAASTEWKGFVDILVSCKGPLDVEALQDRLEKRLQKVVVQQERASEMEKACSDIVDSEVPVSQDLMGELLSAYLTLADHQDELKAVNAEDWDKVVEKCLQSCLELVTGDTVDLLACKGYADKATSLRDLVEACGSKFPLSLSRAMLCGFPYRSRILPQLGPDRSRLS